MDEEQSRPYMAVDCEMIEVSGPGSAPARKVVVSIGCVDQALETLLFARVRAPTGCKVLNDSFARMTSALGGDWNSGLHVVVAQSMIRRFASDGGTLVGWQIDYDLDALGFAEGAKQLRQGVRSDIPLSTQGSADSTSVITVNVVELTDHFKTAVGKAKCQLREAFRVIFGREFSAHRADDDARATMELYRTWSAQNGDIIPPPIFLPLTFYCVTAHCFKPPEDAMKLLWQCLRPEKTVTGDDYIESDPDFSAKKYQLQFRRKAPRDSHLNTVMQRAADLGYRPLEPRQAQVGESIMLKEQQTGRSFILHIFDKQR